MWLGTASVRPFKGGRNLCWCYKSGTGSCRGQVPRGSQTWGTRKAKTLELFGRLKVKSNLKTVKLRRCFSNRRPFTGLSGVHRKQTSKMGHEWRRTGVAVRPQISHPVLVSVKGWKAHKFSWLSVYRETERDRQGMDESADTCYPQTFQPLSHNHRLIIRHDPINVLSGCWLHLSKHVLHILEQDWLLVTNVSEPPKMFH